MIPFNRAMYVDYPTDSAAYNRHAQFLLGDNLLAAPITSPGQGDNLEASQKVWFPSDSRWYDFFTDESYAPGSEAVVTKNIYSFPVFIRGGHILPMQPYTQRPGSEKLTTLVMRLYPGTDGESTVYSLYEDDGISRDYEKGRYAKTALRYEQDGSRGTVTVEPTAGEYDGQPTVRAYRLELADFGNVSDIRVDGRKAGIEHRDGRTFVNVPKRDIRKATRITFTHSAE